MVEVYVRRSIVLSSMHPAALTLASWVGHIVSPRGDAVRETVGIRESDGAGITLAYTLDSAQQTLDLLATAASSGRRGLVWALVNVPCPTALTLTRRFATRPDVLPEPGHAFNAVPSDGKVEVLTLQRERVWWHDAATRTLVIDMNQAAHLALETTAVRVDF